MVEDRLKTWLGFAQFILGSVVLAIVTLLVNHKIQEREVEVKEQEQMGKFLEHALIEDVGVRRRFAQYFAAVTRSETLRDRWQVYLVEVEQEYAEKEKELHKLEQEVKQLRGEVNEPESASQAIELEQKVAKVEELSAALQPKPKADRSLPPARVYFHIKTESQRGAAQELARKATSELGLVVPGIQRLDAVPRESELRYFKTAEETEAKSITDFLNKSGLRAAPKYVPGFETSTRLRPRHYELWISEKDSQSQASGTSDNTP